MVKSHFSNGGDGFASVLIMSVKPRDDWTDLTAAAGDEQPRLDLTSTPEKPPRHLLLPALFIISIVALATGWLSKLNPLPQPPTESELTQGRQTALHLAGKAVDEYARRNGHYPKKLDDAILLPSDLNIEYVPHASGFELRIVDDVATSLKRSVSK